MIKSFPSALSHPQALNLLNLTSGKVASVGLSFNRSAMSLFHAFIYSTVTLILEKNLWFLVERCIQYIVPLFPTHPHHDHVPPFIEFIHSKKNKFNCHVPRLDLGIQRYIRHSPYPENTHSYEASVSGVSIMY